MTDRGCPCRNQVPGEPVLGHGMLSAVHPWLSELGLPPPATTKAEPRRTHPIYILFLGFVATARCLFSDVQVTFWGLWQRQAVDLRAGSAPEGWELGGSRGAAAVTSHGSAPCAAGIGGPVMRLVVTVHGKQPLLKPQYLSHLI